MCFVILFDCKALRHDRESAEGEKEKRERESRNTDQTIKHNNKSKMNFKTKTHWHGVCVCILFFCACVSVKQTVRLSTCCVRIEHLLAAAPMTWLLINTNYEYRMLCSALINAMALNVIGAVIVCLPHTLVHTCVFNVYVYGFNPPLSWAINKLNWINWFLSV